MANNKQKTNRDTKNKEIRERPGENALNFKIFKERFNRKPGNQHEER